MSLWVGGFRVEGLRVFEFGGHGYINSFCNLNNHEITQIITREIIYIL